MKNKKTLFVGLFLAFVWLLLLPLPVLNVHADEGAVGGVVQTKGEITFYDETTSPSTSDSSVPPTSSEAPKLKPKGRFPSTGELVKRSLSIGGITLILTFFLFYFWKLKKEKNKGEKD